jgi:glutamate racemase
MSATIGIFDSGVGGLGIFHELTKQCPGQSIVYCADNNNLPFGEKTTAQLQEITSKILKYLICEHDIKLAVVACNTASVSSLEYLRQRFSIPIVGVVPVVKPACELSKIKKVAILATPHTVRSEYQKQLIVQYGRDVEVLSIPCPDLVGLIEAGCFADPQTTEKVQEYLAPALAIGVDVIGLACTHYPFIRGHIQAIVPAGVTIIDANEAVARHAVKVLEKMPEVKAYQTKAPVYSFVVTKEPEQFQRVARVLIGNIITAVKLISL